MSEEKLYMVRNDEGKYLDMNLIPWWNDKAGSTVKAIDLALSRAKNYDGHVVTFIEEPEKVVLTKEQAEIFENNRDIEFPANYISACTLSSDDEKLLMDAYVNGYTVEKDKKYNVKVPHTKDGWYFKASEEYLLTICSSDKKLHGKFTEKEIADYGLQDCEKEEVTDDGEEN